MKIFSWNCRGLGRPRTVRALRDAMRSLSPQIVGLMETKKRASDIEGVRCKLGFRNGFGVSCRGRSGGLALFWDDSLCLEILNYSVSHIDAVIRDQGLWRLTLFYGNPAVNRRCESWNLLRQLRSLNDIQWIVLGDFNEVLSLKEVRGGRMRHNWQMENFRKAMDDCFLSDLGFTGYPYTFSNHREGDLEVQARLDRALADVDWMRNFPKASVAHVHLNASDHQLLVVETDGKCQRSRTKLFRFEVMWLDHPQYDVQMRDFWSSCEEGGGRWSTKLKTCKEMLKSWNQVAFGNLCKRIEKLKQELETVKSGTHTGEVVERERKIGEELDLWLAREEAL
ncbi:unnamed protein product [Rhodiola kirilowii]